MYFPENKLILTWALTTADFCFPLFLLFKGNSKMVEYWLIVVIYAFNTEFSCEILVVTEENLGLMKW